MGQGRVALGIQWGDNAGMMLRLTLVLVLAACTSGEPVKPYKTKQQRQAELESALSKTPIPRTYRFDGNELRVIELPVAGLLGTVEHQRCFVWRDIEFRSATLSCSQMPDVYVPEN